jgi:hypothetical protein
MLIPQVPRRGQRAALPEEVRDEIIEMIARMLVRVVGRDRAIAAEQEVPDESR